MRALSGRFLHIVQMVLVLPHGLAFLFAGKTGLFLLDPVLERGFSDIGALSLFLVCFFIVLGSGVYIVYMLRSKGHFWAMLLCGQAGLGGMGLALTGNPDEGTCIALLYGLSLYILKKPIS